MAFPTIWQLLTPTFSQTTWFGVVLILLGLLGWFVGGVWLRGIPSVAGGFIKVSTILFSAGLIFVFGVSLIQNIFKSMELTVLVVAFLVLGVIAISLFGYKKKE